MTGICFGAPQRKSLTGAELAIRVFQVFSLLPVPYIAASSVRPATMLGEGPLAHLASLGFASVPRAEALLLSTCYRATMSEISVTAILLVAALACGIVLRRLLAKDGGSAAPVRWAYAVWLALDLALRLVPAPFNLAFGVVPEALGFAVRLACLALVLLDLRAMARAAA